MTDQWTPNGDKWPQPAMVMVAHIKHVEGVSVCVGNDGKTRWMPHTALCPMPPAITPKQQAVLDAAEVQSSAELRMVRDRGPYDLACARTNTAVRAMLAAQQPPDPVKELLAAAKDAAGLSPQHARLRAAIAALEKEKKS